MNMQKSITSKQICAVVFIAVVAGSIPALQPILLGGLLTENQVTATQMGQAATIEGLAMAVAAGLAGAFLQPTRLRLITVLAALGMVLANGVTGIASGSAVLAARGLNGTASGVLLWLLIGLLTRSPSPARLFAIYVTCQAITAFLLSSIYTAWIIPKFGVTGSYSVLALLGIVMMLLSMFVPIAYSITPSQTGKQWPTMMGLVGLIAIVCYLAGVMSFWIYLAPLCLQLGHPQSNINHAISLSLGVQILGGLAATFLATRLSSILAFIISAVVSTVAVLIILRTDAMWLLFVGTSLFAFFWMFAPPFHLPLLIGLDSSNRSAMFVSSAQLGGMFAGPMIASVSITERHFNGAAIASIAFFIASVVFVISAYCFVQRSSVENRGTS